MFFTIKEIEVYFRWNNSIKINKSKTYFLLFIDLPKQGASNFDQNKQSVPICMQ